MPPCRTIADFKLVRNTTKSFMDLRLDFVHICVGETTASDWRFCKTTNSANTDLQFSYAVCASEGVFVLFDAYLTNGQDLSGKSYRRYTEMRAWELLVDCWTDAAQSDTNSLRWIGISDIVNADVRKMILREIESQVSAGGARASRVTVGSDSVTWRENYFTRTAERAARALNKRVVGAMLSSTDVGGGANRAPNDPGIVDIFSEMHMILELEDVPTDELPSQASD